MKSTFAILILLLSLHRTDAQHQNFHWLAGTWKLEGKSVFEVWQITEGGESLQGWSFSVKGVDTVVTEVITLQYYNGSFHYIPDVAGDQPPIDFTGHLLRRS